MVQPESHGHPGTGSLRSTSTASGRVISASEEGRNRQGSKRNLRELERAQQVGDPGTGVEAGRAVWGWGGIQARGQRLSQTCISDGPLTCISERPKSKVLCHCGPAEPAEGSCLPGYIGLQDGRAQGIPPKATAARLPRETLCQAPRPSIPSQLLYPRLIPKGTVATPPKPPWTKQSKRPSQHKSDNLCFIQAKLTQTQAH